MLATRSHSGNEWNLRYVVQWTEYKSPPRPVACCCSVTKLCLTLCNPITCSMPDFPVFCYLPEFAHTHVYWVDDAISSFLSYHRECLNQKPKKFLILWLKNEWGTSLVVQWLRICLPIQETQVWSLAGELRSHIPRGIKVHVPQWRANTANK